MQVKVVGRAAVDEAVATAMNNASNIFFVNLSIFFLVTNMYNPGNTTKAFLLFSLNFFCVSKNQRIKNVCLPCIIKPSITVSM